MSDRSTPEELVAKARRIAEGAYAPYSKFHVGAIVVAADGTEYSGVNVENAAYGSTMCAEATAIGTAVSAGVRHIDTLAVGTVEGSDHYPCGNCRQLMQEFGVERIVVPEPGGGVRIHTLEELLPHLFGPENLPDTSEGP
jgi:cytidine deaminase